MRQIWLIAVVLLGVMTSHAKHNVPKSGSTTDIDILSAQQYCAGGNLNAIEGIWRYAEEGFSCLIQKQIDDSYRIIAIEAEDASVSPGMVLGYLYVTPSANIYDMYLYTDVSNDRAVRPRECVATLSSDGEGLALGFKKYKLTPNPVALLPWMWRLMRLNIENPIEKMPHGLVKVAPSYDGDGSSRRNPRYL